MDESVKHVPEQDWPGRNGTVEAAMCNTLEPMSYVGENGALAGFDIELILMIARELDVHVSFTGMELASVLSSVQSGKAQLVGGSIIATDERKEMMDFVLYHPASFVMVVRGTADESSGHNSDSSFLSRLYGSFYRTFVKDDRYKMVLSGLGLTVLMSLSSGVIGLILAYLLVLLRHKNHRISNSLIAVYESRDVPGMLAGLQEFCSRQMMGPKATRNTVLAVEELAVSRILPVLDRGKKGRVKLILQSEEGGVNRILSIDCGSLPGGEEVVLRETDEISSAILRNIVRRLPEKESRGTLRYEIL